MMSRRAFAAGVLLLAWSVPVRAERLPLRLYSTADGLAHNTVNRIVRDSRGFLWFCTEGGLSRFDGYEFTNFGVEQGLPRSSVNDLLETRAGEYWVATDGGLVRFNPRGTPDRRVVDDRNPSMPASMFTVIMSDDDAQRAREITVLREARDGTIWAGTNAGLRRLVIAAGHRFLETVDIHLPDEFPEQRFIADVLEDADGSLWIAAPSGLYRRLKNGNSVRYTEKDGLPGTYLSSLFQDHDGHLWATTRLTGFFGFRVEDGTDALSVGPWFSIGLPGSTLPTSWVSRFFESSDGKFWLGTPRGLVQFLPEAPAPQRFRTWASGNGLIDVGVSALTEDLSGNLWLGTAEAGAMKLARGGFTMYSRQDGIEAVTAAFEDRAHHLCFKGNVLGDTRDSVFDGGQLDPLAGEQPIRYTRLGCFDGQRFDWFRPGALAPLAWANSWVMEWVTHQARNGEWWLGTSEGLFRFAATDRFKDLSVARPLAVYTTQDGLAAPQVYRLFEDSRGDIWISTTAAETRGLSRWDHASNRVRNLAGTPGLPSLEDGLPIAFGEDGSGAVWIGYGTGLGRYRQGRFTMFTSRDGLPPGAIRDIYSDHEGRLWLASENGGLVRIDSPESEQPTFLAYTTRQGLSSDNVNVITQDQEGFLYVGGGNGLDRFDPATGRVKQFTAADGLTPGTVKSAFRDHTGVLWFGTSTGLARLAPALEMPAPPPQILVSDLRVSGVPRQVSALGEDAIVLEDLEPGQSQLQIEFVGLSFAPGEVLRYQYRLEGADAEWSTPDTERSANYARLAPGHYRFVVQAVNSEGTASDRPAFIAFTILQPVWLRAWFLALMAAAAGLLISAVVRYRIDRLRDVANMRMRIATDLHDDIGANLTRIALLSEALRRRSPVGESNPASRQPPPVPDLGPEDGPLASIARIARESVSSMSEIVWAINPARDSLLDVIRKMRQHADEVFTLRGIELCFDAPDSSRNVKVGVGIRRDLLLICKEAVNNCARHARCSRVAISLNIERSRLVLTLADNGIGFDTSIEQEGHGLVSMVHRAKRLGGMLAVVSGPGVGTSVTLSIPV